MGMIEPKWSDGDTAYLNTVTLADGESLTAIEGMMYRHGVTDERRRVLYILMYPQNRGLTRRELAELIARGR